MTRRQNSFDIVTDLQDVLTPFGAQLRGIYKRSGSFIALRDRLPVILTRVIDTLSRDKEEIVQKYGKSSAEDLKQVIGYISKLKNELVTNKPLRPLTCPSSEDDPLAKNIKVWNDYLEERTKLEGGVPNWFNTIALYSECYMYRRIIEAFTLTETLKYSDPYIGMKEQSYTGALDSAISIASYTQKLLKNSKDLSPSDVKKEFAKYLRLGVWGNKFDLSLNGGIQTDQIPDPLGILESLEKDLLIDNTDFVWNFLKKAQEKNESTRIDIVLDNAGYELFTDLCIAVFLIAFNLAKKINFYVKSMPWFISDVTSKDFYWTIEQIKGSSNPDLAALGKVMENHLESGTWSIVDEPFWSYSFSFNEMASRDPALYAKLSEATFIIFKGDLNYRKLGGDINWEYSTSFIEALQGFLPSTFVSLRSIKSNVCAGLKPGLGQSLDKSQPNWMLTGQYGLIEATIDACPCSEGGC